MPDAFNHEIYLDFVVFVETAFAEDLLYFSFIMLFSQFFNEKGDFFILKSKERKKRINERSLIDIGIASDTAMKNYNPNLKVEGGD